MKLGDAFLMGNPGGSTKHLWILISDPAKHNSHGIIVNLTTDKERSGGECRLSVGDHRWLTCDCWVSYADARLIASDQWRNIQYGIRQRILIEQPPVAAAALAKIIAAAKKSTAFAPVFLKYLP
jgi:hypothetical protein